MKNKYYITVSALFTAIIFMISQISFLTPSGVAFTFGILGVCLCGFILGAKWSTASVVTYLFAGAVGLPVFSGFKGGFHVLTGVSGGFLWGFIILAFLCGLASRFNKTNISVILSIIGVILCHLSGIIQYCFVSQVDFLKAFLMVSLPFLPKDLLLAVLSVFLAKKITKRIKIF